MTNKSDCKHRSFKGHNSEYDMARCADCGEWMNFEDAKFYSRLADIHNTNQDMISLQNGDALGIFSKDEVRAIELNYHIDFIRKCFSDTLRARESLRDLKDGQSTYHMVELALIDAYEAMTGDKLEGDL